MYIFVVSALIAWHWIVANPVIIAYDNSDPLHPKQVLDVSHTHPIVMPHYSVTTRDSNDPSNTAKKDWGQVIGFVENNTDVIREVGSPGHAVLLASYTEPGASLPSRYMVYIPGGSKPAYAVVDVSRLSGPLKPTLACITHRSTHEFRGRLLDICK